MDEFGRKVTGGGTTPKQDVFREEDEEVGTCASQLFVGQNEKAPRSPVLTHVHMAVALERGVRPTLSLRIHGTGDYRSCRRAVARAAGTGSIGSCPGPGTGGG